MYILSTVGMQDERSKAVGEYHKRVARRKEGRSMSTNSSPTHSSDDSLSLSPVLLPEGNDDKNSSISEHMSSINSIENDRSFQEIEISHLPSNLSLIIQGQSDEISNISQEKRPSLTSSDSILLSSASKNARSILDEILRNDQFRSQKSDSVSLDIFDGVNLDDSSINDYVARLKPNEVSFAERNLLSGQFNNSHELEDDSETTIQNLKELLSVKDNVIDALHSEVDSLKEMASNPSTFSLHTLTEYKQCQEECTNKIVEFKNALSHRDGIIENLTDSLQKSIANEHELRAECEQFAKDIQVLQTELAEATEYIKTHECGAQMIAQDDDKSEQQFVKEIQGLQAELAEATEYIKGHQCELMVVAQDVDNNAQNKSESLQQVCSDLEDLLTPAQIVVLDDVKVNINEYIQRKIAENVSVHGGELQMLKDEFEHKKTEYNKELSHLRELLANVRAGSPEIKEVRKELNAKYMKEMEELRTYYEKKCADVEKNYSDEIFSQQSRKMSGSSTGSDEFSSNLLYTTNAPQSGPGGDTGAPNFSKDDLQAFKAKLNNLANSLNKFNLDMLSDEEQAELKGELDEVDKKIDLVALQNELQSRYNAELEDYESRMEILKVDHANAIKLYDEQVESLKYKLSEAQRDVSSAVQEVANSGEYELADIVQSYQVRLQEQIVQAKIDIMSELHQQIQILASNPCDDSAWPDEFLQIRNVFTEKYEAEINELKDVHKEEVAKIKEDHLKTLNGALERARRRSLRDSESFADMEVINERNNLKKSTTVFRNLLAELLKYFTQCEDELNNTLVDELLKRMSDLDEDTLIDETDSSTTLKRVHLTPNIAEVMTIVEKTTFDSRDVSLEFKNELDTCLERLKFEANAVLALTTNVKQQPDSFEDRNKSLEERITSLTRQLITDSQIKEDLSTQLTEARAFVKSLEMERVHLERQLEGVVAKNAVVERELCTAKERIGHLIDCGRKEVVSEGYGENDKMGLHGGSVSRSTLSELQERARQLAAASSTKSDNPLLQLVEELCREGERLVEEANKEREDYQQQIEAAGKKLRANTVFLEEQAIEREQERDEAQKDMDALKDQLREREKDKSSYERITKEVEQLEVQMRTMSKLIEEGELKNTELSDENKEAVEKIHDLRDIISDLESQVDYKLQGEKELKDIISKLENVIKQQREVNDELSVQLETGRDSANYKQHIINLEEQLQKLRVANELAGNEGVFKQIQLQLHEIEVNIDLGTRDLENLHSGISLTNCSSPSEEISIRDQIRPPTPTTAMDDCEVPLQQLARLKEKLVKHTRAENAAVKRIQDLEMQLISAKHEQDAIQSERDVLQEQVSEQLVLISSLQMRLDDQRIRAEHIQKQTNASLEVKIYDLENEMLALKDTLHAKDNLIKQLNKSIQQTKELLQDRDRELNAAIDEELQTELEQVRKENQLLHAKIESDSQNAQLLPGLVDNIIADKNRDIENLRTKLSDVEKQLEMVVKLNLNQDLSKSEERGILSFINMTNPDVMRRANTRAQSLELSEIPFSPKSKIESEISSIERIGPPNINYTVDAPLIKPNSTEIHRSTEKHVHFKDTAEVSNNSDKVIELEELINKERGVVSALQTELLEIKSQLAEKDKNLEFVNEDIKRKDDMYYKLAREKHDLEKRVSDEVAELNIKRLQSDELFQELNTIKSKFIELENENISLKDNQEKFNVIQNDYLELHKKESELLQELSRKNNEIQGTTENNLKLQKEIDNKIKQLSDINDEMIAIKIQIGSLQDELSTKSETIEQQTAEIARMKHLLVDRECELEILHEDTTRYQNDIAELESKLKTKSGETDQLNLMKQRKEVAKKDLEIVKLKTAIDDLKKEIIHLQDFLTEKDKIIDQVSSDSESLRINLETIRAKMNEQGNMVDLREQLQQEKAINMQLRSEIDDIGSIEDISEKVRKELDYSAHLDETIIHVLSSDDFANITDIELLKTAISKERERNNQAKIVNEQHIKSLEEKIVASNDFIKILKTTVENERKVYSEMQVEDANLLEQMRIKLESVMENENDFEKVLNEEKLKRESLENEIVALRQKINDNLSSTSSKTEYKALPNADTEALKQELQRCLDENQAIKKDMKSLKSSKKESEASLKYTKDMLNLKSKEIEKLQKNFAEVNEELILSKCQVDEVKFEIQERMKEIENSRILLEEMEQENMEYKRNINRLNDRIIALEDEKKLNEEALANHKTDLTAPVPDKFLQKMKDLSDMVINHIRENKAMTDTLSKLTDERTALQERVRQLEEQHNMQMPFDDPVARANHLFGKYLRADSYRNALAYQKKYLIKLLTSYQDHPFAISGLQSYDPKTRKTRSKGIHRFRSAICVVIAIHRMQYMVQRWHSGSRKATYMSLRRRFKALEAETDTTHFQVGQPVSSQHFVTNMTTTRLDRDELYRGPGRSRDYDIGRPTTPPRSESQQQPWSGNTPPNKDQGLRSSRHSSASTSKDSFVPLEAPNIAKYIERFKLIQEKFGMALNDPAT